MENVLSELSRSENSNVMDSLNQLSLKCNAVGMQLAKLPARQQPVCVGFEEGVFCRCVGMEFQAADASGYERR